MTFRYFPILLVVVACSPYENGEFNAGPVDPSNFPLAYKGTGGDTNVNGYRAGAGKFTETAAFINGSSAGYYSFPFTSRQLTASDPLIVYLDKDPKAPVAYAFDPQPPNPFPS